MAMTDDELGALVDAEMRIAIGFDSGKLADQRRKAEYYFYGEAKEDLAPPSIPGRSSVVVPVVRNTIEAMLPQLMVKFTGGDTVVEFEPVEQGDEAKAKQATGYLKYLFFKKNNGHTVTYSWFKDALKYKRGIVKVWWDNRDEETREEYKGQTPESLVLLQEDPEIEIIEQKSYPDEEDAAQRQKALEALQAQLDQAVADPNGGQAVMAIQQQMAQIMSMPPAERFDVTCKRTKSGGKICIENVPPEEFGISRKAKMSIQEAPAVFHRFRRTKSELLSMGYPKGLIEQLGNDTQGDDNAETYERRAYDDEWVQEDEDSLDESQRRYWVVECYVRVDFDGDGIAELRKVTRCGGKTLDNEITDVIPFVSICPIPEPHKFFGLSIADMAMEGQRTETAILRSTLDNLYLEVNGRYFAVEGQVNLDDLLSSRPGGVVRTKSQGAVGRLDQGKGNLGESMSMLEFMKGFNEDSTGWSRQSQGNDPSQLSKPETATKANIVTNRADMRLDLIARNFAEGFVDLFRMMLKLVCQYQDKAATVRLAGNWTQLDPREWRNQFDVSINVGLGVGNKDQQVAHLTQLLQVQAQAVQIGVATPENIYNSAVELAKNMGFKSGDKFFAKPDPNAKLPDPAQGEIQKEQMKSQAAVQMKQAEIAAQTQLERERMQMQAEVDRNRQQVEMEQQTAKMQMQMQMEQFKTEQQMQLEREKAQMQAQIAIETARINAQGRLDAAQVSAQATLSAEQEAASDVATND